MSRAATNQIFVKSATRSSSRSRFVFFREVIEGVKISFAALLSNKLRSALTTLGIVIGIVTVTLMGTAISGLRLAFMESISSMGADVLFVSRVSWFIRSHQEWMKSANRPEITMSQMKRLREEMTMSSAMSPFAATRRPVSYKNRRSDLVMIIGTTEEFQQTSSIGVSEGRFLTAGEVEGSRPFCVLGSLVASNLFQKVDSPIGKKVRIGNFDFEVVGVLEKQGSFLGQFSLDNQVIIPVKQIFYHFKSWPDIEIRVKVTSLARLEDAKEELRGILRKIRRVPPGDPDDFSIQQQESFIEKFNKVGGVIASVGLFITGLSLFVGGIGIMNIMFVSVAERTREIGIRKALGAKRRSILLQFIAEAASICLFAGLVGIAIAFPLTFFMQKFLPAQISLPVLGLSLILSLVTGVVAGFLPAWRAARMNPVDALRNE